MKNSFSGNCRLSRRVSLAYASTTPPSTFSRRIRTTIRCMKPMWPRWTPDSSTCSLLNRVHGAGQNGLDQPNGVLLSKKIAEKYFDEEQSRGPADSYEWPGTCWKLQGWWIFQEIPVSTMTFSCPRNPACVNSWTWRDPSYILLKQDVDSKSLCKERSFPF